MQEASGSARVHSILRLNPGNQLRGQGGAPGPVIHRVGELVGACQTALIKQHPDHLGHFTLFHAVIEKRSKAGAEPLQTSPEAMSEVDGWEAIFGMAVVAGRTQPRI